jgi:hypothetical protein
VEVALEADDLRRGDAAPVGVELAKKTRPPRLDSERRCASRAIGSV